MPSSGVHVSSPPVGVLVGTCAGVRTSDCACVYAGQTSQTPLPQLLSPSLLPTSPRLGAQATVGGCHGEVTLTATGDSLGGRKERILPPPAPDTPLLSRKPWPPETRQDGLGWMLLARDVS